MSGQGSVVHGLDDPDHEPCPDCPIPGGVPWGAAMPYVMARVAARDAHIEALVRQVDTLTARLDAIDPPQEAP